MLGNYFYNFPYHLRADYSKVLFYPDITPGKYIRHFGLIIEITAEEHCIHETI